MRSRHLACAAALSAALASGVSAQPNLGAVHSKNGERWHAGVLDPEVRYVLPSKVELASEDGRPHLKLVRFDLDGIPGVLTRDLTRYGTLQTRWAVRWPTGPGEVRKVPVVWAGLGTSNERGTHLTAGRSDATLFHADTPLNRQELSLLWGDGKHLGIFAPRTPAAFPARLLLVYSGKRRLDGPLEASADTRKLSGLFEELGGDQKAVPFVEGEVERFVTAAIKSGAVRLTRPTGELTRDEILALFGALRREALEYDLSPVGGKVPVLAFRLAGRRLPRSVRLRVPDLADSEAAHALTVEWPREPLARDCHRHEQAFSLDGVPATQRVHFYLPPDAARTQVKVVMVEVVYEESGRDYVRKTQLILRPSRPEATWSFQTRYPFAAVLKHRVFLTRETEGKRLLQSSDWFEAKEKDSKWHFAIPDHHVSLGEAIRQALETRPR
jgi:hypothetical protein